MRDCFDGLSSGQFGPGQRFVCSQEFRVASYGALEQGDRFFHALQVEQRVTHEIIQFGRRGLMPEKVLKQWQGRAVVLPKLQADGELFLDLRASGRKLQGFAPLAGSLAVFLLTAVNAGF